MSIILVNHRYKLLVLDIDGTLLNGQGKISSADIEALSRAQNSGVQVSLSTGRSLKACLKIINRLELDNYHIFFDGALVSNPDLTKEVYVQPLSKKTLQQIVLFARSHDIDLELFSATRYFAERETWSTEAHRQFFGIESSMTDFTGIWKRERIIKGGLVTTNVQEEAKAESIRSTFGDSLQLSAARTPAYPGIVFFNILAPRVSKGKALEALTLHTEISLDEVIAIGDGTNDISLLSSAGLAIAMGNAPDEVKKVANHITLDVDHSGLAAAINKFLL